MGILLRMGRPVAVWGASGPPRAVRAALRRPVAVWGASGPPRAVRAALRRPVAVWGHLGPRGPSGPLSGVLWRSGGIWAPEGRQGRSPASCGGLGASGPRGPSGPLSGVLWRSGGIWAPEGRQGRSPASCGGLGGIWAPEGRQGRSPASCGGLGGIWVPRLEFSGQLSRKVAQGFDRGEDFRAQQAPQKTQKCSTYTNPTRLCGIRQHTLVATTRLRLALTTRAGEGAFRPLQSPEAARAAAKPSFPCLGRAMSVRFCPLPSASGAGRRRPLRPCGLLVRRCAWRHWGSSRRSPAALLCAV